MGWLRFGVTIGLALFLGNWTWGAVLTTGPCDILSTQGTPCVAAHSVTRRLLGAYSGSLFQIQRASDSATLNIGSNASTGLVNLAPSVAFCNATTCGYSIIYDQSGNHNDLPVVNTTNEAALATDTFTHGAAVPILTTTCTGGCSIHSGNLAQAYRKRAGTVGIPTGANPITVYEVRANYQSSTCCGDYGNMQNPVGTGTGAGSLFATVYSTLNATPAQVGIDYESANLTESASVPTRFTLIDKHGGGTTTIKLGDATTGSLTSLYASTDPATFNLQGGISWGEGGDGTPSLTNGYEAAIVASATTTTADNLVQANIVAFYGAL